MTSTQVRQPAALPVLIGVGTLAVGLVLGWFAPALARGLADVIGATPLPVPGVVRLVGTLELPWTLGILGGLGLLGGAFVAVVVVGEAPVLTVAGDHLEHEQEERAVWVERSDVGAAFRDGNDLVLLRPGGGLRARLDVDTLSGARVRDALTAHHWPWSEGDPHEGEFERWIDGRPGLTAGENEVLRRRLAERKDAAARRRADEELDALGLVARVRDDRLQVRRSASATGRATEGARGTDR